MCFALQDPDSVSYTHLGRCALLCGPSLRWTHLQTEAISPAGTPLRQDVYKRQGYTDGFNHWCKQVAAICLTAFMQTTLLFLGLLTFPDHMLLGLGIMLVVMYLVQAAKMVGNDFDIHYYTSLAQDIMVAFNKCFLHKDTAQSVSYTHLRSVYGRMGFLCPRTFRKGDRRRE